MLCTDEVLITLAVTLFLPGVARLYSIKQSYGQCGW